MHTLEPEWVCAYERYRHKEILTWSRRRGWWTRRGRWWLQTPGHIGWGEMDGEEQKQGHLLLPQPPHRWNPASETEREGRKTAGEVDVYCLPTVKGALRVKMANMVFVWEEGPWLHTWRENQHYAKQQLKGNMRDCLCTDTQCLPALIQSLKNRGFFLFI